MAHLGLTDFDLGGFSLGARTTVEGVGEGLKAAPGGARRRGSRGLRNWERRKNFFSRRSNCSTASRAATRTGCRSSS